MEFLVTTEYAGKASGAGTKLIWRGLGASTKLNSSLELEISPLPRRLSITMWVVCVHLIL
jgi:hypothetical protein